MRMRTKRVAVPVLATLTAATTVALASPSTAAPSNVIGVNAGGEAVQGAQGVFAKDAGFVGGYTSATTATVSGTVEPARFQTQHVGMSGYRQPVSAPGGYQVTLDFAETYHDAAGLRAFTVEVEGAELARDLDIYALAGKNKALSLSIEVPVTDGALDVAFRASKDLATVSAISVIPVGPASWSGARPTGEVGGAWSGTPGSAELSWRRTDGQVGVGTWSSGTGVPAELTLGGDVQGAPALAGRRSGSLEVFARGTDDQLWTAARSAAGAWSSWQPLGGVLSGRPAVATFLNDELHVFGRGSDGALWHRWSVAPRQWSPWERLGGGLAPGTGPAVVSTGPGRLEVVVHGTDHQAWRLSYSAGWSNWTPVGGRLDGDPAVASAAGELTVVVLGDGRTPYSTTVDNAGVVAPWQALGGQLSSAPSATAVPGGGRVEVFGTGTDQGFYHTTRTAAGWAGWQPIA